MRNGNCTYRWATHGEPSETNAHPHSSGTFAVVHNGIIENHEELRKLLKSRGYVFLSQTDTEVIAHLVEWECVARIPFRGCAEIGKTTHGRIWDGGNG